MYKTIPALSAAVRSVAAERQQQQQQQSSSPSSIGKNRMKSGSKMLPDASTLDREDASDSDEDVDHAMNEMLKIQLDIKKSTLRIAQKIREIDDNSLKVVEESSKSPSTSPIASPQSSFLSTKPTVKGNSSPDKVRSNQGQFLDEQARRAKTVLPIEYYNRQLQFKRINREIIEVSDRIDFNARNFRRSLVDLGIEPTEEDQMKRVQVEKERRLERGLPLNDDEELEDLMIEKMKEDIDYFLRFHSEAHDSNEAIGKPQRFNDLFLAFDCSNESTAAAAASAACAQRGTKAKVPSIFRALSRDTP